MPPRTMPAHKKQKTSIQPSLDSAPPRSDGLTEVPAEDDDDDYTFEDPLDETKQDEQLDQETTASSSSKEIREIEFCTMVDAAQAKVNGKIRGGISLPARRAAERVYLDFPNRITDIVKGPSDLLELMIDDLSAVMLLYHEDRGKIAERKPLAELNTLIPPRPSTVGEVIFTKEWEDIKRQAIEEAQEMIKTQGKALAIYASCVRGAESTYVQYGMPGESDTVQGTSTFFVLLVTDLARLMLEVADGKRIGDLLPSEEVMNLHVSDPGGVVPFLPEAERTGLLAFGRRTKPNASASSIASASLGSSTTRGNTSGSSTPANSPMGKSGSAHVKTRNCIVRKFFVIDPTSNAKINILVTLQNLWSYGICQWMIDPEATRDHNIKKYFQKFQVDHHHAHIHDSFPYPPDSKLTGLELHARLEDADFSQYFFTAAGITPIPLKDSNILDLKKMFLKKPKALKMKPDYIPAAMFWINADEVTGPTKEESDRLQAAFEYLTDQFEGFVDITNPRESESIYYFYHQYEQNDLILNFPLGLPTKFVPDSYEYPKDKWTDCYVFLSGIFYEDLHRRGQI